MYRLKDNTGRIFWQWEFSSYDDADNFRALMGRRDWHVVDK